MSAQSKAIRAPLQVGRRYQDRCLRRWRILHITNAGKVWGVVLPAMALAICEDQVGQDTVVGFPQWFRADTGTWCAAENPLSFCPLDLVRAA